MVNAVAGSDLSTLDSLARRGWNNQQVKPKTVAAHLREAKVAMRQVAAKESAPAKPEPARAERQAPVKGKYSIDKAIPIPSKSVGPSRLVYPYAQLAVGDSFFVPLKTYAITNKMPGKQFISRPWTQDGKEGRRVWRVK